MLTLSTVVLLHVLTCSPEVDVTADVDDDVVKLRAVASLMVLYRLLKSMVKSKNCERP
jgi:hypothetical protein